MLGREPSVGSDLEETTSQDHETMSGNEPYSEETPDFADAAAGDIYGAPRSNVERTGPAAGELAAPLPLREPKHVESDGIDLREPASLGNRPASGARVVS